MDNNQIINNILDLLDEAIMACYNGLIDEEKDNSAVTNYYRKKDHLNYYECYFMVIDYFLNGKTIMLPEETEKIIDEKLDKLRNIVLKEKVNSEQIRRALLLLDIKGFKNLNFSLDLITPDTIGIIMAKLVDIILKNKKEKTILDVNAGVGNLIFTISNHAEGNFHLIGIDNHELMTKVIVRKANLLNQKANFYFDDALSKLPTDIDLIVSDLACYDYENKDYHSYLYDHNVKYFPYLVIEHFLEIKKEIYALYLIENNFFNQNGNKLFHEMLKDKGQIIALITLPISFFQSDTLGKSIIIVSNKPNPNVSINIFMLPDPNNQKLFLEKLDEIKNFLNKMEE